jgi:hypothetical protein
LTTVAPIVSDQAQGAQNELELVHIGYAGREGDLGFGMVGAD